MSAFTRANTNDWIILYKKKIKEIIKEATSTSGSRGSYVGPLQIGIRLFEKDKLGPFTIPVSDYDSPELEYDSYDGKMDTPKKKIKSLEKKAKKIFQEAQSTPRDAFYSISGGGGDAFLINHMSYTFHIQKIKIFHCCLQEKKSNII